MKAKDLIVEYITFYFRDKMTVIRAISTEKIVAVMIMNSSMDGNDFKVFIEECWLLRWFYGTVLKSNIYRKCQNLKSLVG